MDTLSNVANIAEIVGVIIVVGGLYFGLLQLRNFRQQRRELAAIELFRFFGNPYFTDAYKTVLSLPDNMSAEDIRDNEVELEEAAMLISATMENIGVMTYQRIVPFTIVNHLMGITAVILWRKLENWVLELRSELDSPATFEWFQWLAERLEEYTDVKEHPAYVAHRKWVPSHLRRRA